MSLYNNNLNDMLVNKTWNDFNLKLEDNKVNNIMNGSKYTVRIMGTKSLDSFEHIAQVYTNTAEYQDKIDKVIQLIDEKATIHVESNKLN